MTFSYWIRRYHRYVLLKEQVIGERKDNLEHRDSCLLEFEYKQAGNRAHKTKDISNLF